MDTRRRVFPYGLDGPPQVVALAGGAVLAALVALGAFVSAAPWPFVLLPAVAAVVLAGCAASFLHASLRGKFAVWRELADGLALRGDEDVLDLGCGSGAVLLLIGRRLTTGRALGVDLWRRRDQWRSDPRTLRENAAAGGMGGRVGLCTADVSALPLVDGCFDVVVTSMTVHNVYPLARRRAALAEAVRVLRPGGRLVMVDIWSAGRARVLVGLGMSAVEARGLGPRMWWCGPFVPTTLVTAVKPLPPRSRDEPAAGPSREGGGWPR
ncbi:class I SAM-dependent methyltransferase [Streptomyces cinnamoneus]|uniref:class I SAM-dependent methyltransferase n=1 Tax=Streptomyces cinnamoneus TaxID=53446 RepID=UPI0015E35A6B|nr:class I SAM-dependent methyltransferase [Streptomyces cinnamoneus]